MGVRILRIPVVALKELLKYLNNVELVKVSLLSRRADWFLKTCGKTNVSFFNLESSEIRDLRNIEILELFLLESKRQGELPDWVFKIYCSVNFEQYISITCIHFNVYISIKTIGDNEEFVGLKRNLRIGKAFVPVVITRDHNGVERIHTILSSKTDGLATIFDCFKDKSNISIEQLNLSGKNTRAMRTVVNHINSTRTVLKNVMIDCRPPLSRDDFHFILKSVSATERFSSHLDLGQNFELEEKICARNINIENGHWFTLRNLLMCDESVVIHVNGSDYTKDELRMFLREWKAGKLPKLKRVELATEVPYWDVIEGFERWEEGCGKFRPGSVITIKGHGDCHGNVYTSDDDGFNMSIHDNTNPNCFRSQVLPVQNARRMRNM